MIGIWFLCFFISNSAEAKIICENPDGKNGYYKSNPTVTIQYDGIGVMKYRLKNAKGDIVAGKLDMSNNSVTIQNNQFYEGNNYLDVWQEDEKGMIQESSVHQKKFMIDQTPPEYPLQFIEGDILEISAQDHISGIANIYFAFEGENFQCVNGNKAFITLPLDFQGRVWAYAVDQAGNQGERCYFEKKKQEPIVIFPEKDIQEKPKIFIEGNLKTQITSLGMVADFTVMNYGFMIDISGLLQKKDMSGETNYELKDWIEVEQGYHLQYEIKEDGIYKFVIGANDEEGNRSELIQQMILDSSSPEIHLSEVIDGKTLKEFQWDFVMEQYVADLTSLYFEVRIDGMLCEKDVVYRKPGKHVLEIYAKDLAGNESRKSMTFYITQ